MPRSVFPLLCGWVIALMLGASAISNAPVDESRPVASVSPSATARSSPGVCYFVCDGWTLYSSLDACLAGCPEWSFCERQCF